MQTHAQRTAVDSEDGHAGNCRRRPDWHGLHANDRGDLIPVCCPCCEEPPTCPKCIMDRELTTSHTDEPTTPEAPWEVRTEPEHTGWTPGSPGRPISSRSFDEITANLFEDSQSSSDPVQPQAKRQRIELLMGYDRAIAQQCRHLADMLDKRASISENFVQDFFEVS